MNSTRLLTSLQVFLCDWLQSSDKFVFNLDYEKTEIKHRHTS